MPSAHMGGTRQSSPRRGNLRNQQIPPKRIYTWFQINKVDQRDSIRDVLRFYMLQFKGLCYFKALVILVSPLDSETSSKPHRKNQPSRHAKCCLVATDRDTSFRARVNTHLGSAWKYWKPFKSWRSWSVKSAGEQHWFEKLLQNAKNCVAMKAPWANLGLKLKPKGPKANKPLSRAAEKLKKKKLPGHLQLLARSLPNHRHRPEGSDRPTCWCAWPEQRLQRLLTVVAGTKMSRTALVSVSKCHEIKAGYLFKALSKGGWRRQSKSITKWQWSKASPQSPGKTSEDVRRQPNNLESLCRCVLNLEGLPWTNGAPEAVSSMLRSLMSGHETLNTTPHPIW